MPIRWPQCSTCAISKPFDWSQVPAAWSNIRILNRRFVWEHRFLFIYWVQLGNHQITFQFRLPQIDAYAALQWWHPKSNSKLFHFLNQLFIFCFLRLQILVHLQHWIDILQLFSLHCFFIFFQFLYFLRSLIQFNLILLLQFHHFVAYSIGFFILKSQFLLFIIWMQ